MMTFTIDEAERCIPTLERLVKKAQRLRDKIAWLIETNDAMVEVSGDEGFHYFMTDDLWANKEFHHLYFEFYKVLERIGALGVILMDVDDGLVDFPFQTNGREAFLCWQLGEKKIQYWHDEESGFEGRMPIVDVDELMNQD